ncbi:unnamed protein product [Ostreobium quekettii]|uniref:Uncharacterized protein n=1 Tax=Ostreobium quekettii TaxID=121088 RepID=A0A8S1INP7_9CHLO|nr:unnamed protein product [Ostreobium quekettii]|eukprot:evm.model.scf_68EXC.6 EVM.evm.TU.scf_68EXC.6   scf_68EXC:94591-95838(-)
MARAAGAIALLAGALLPVAKAQGFFSDNRCNEENGTGCAQSSSPALEDNGSVVGFGIVTAIIILVVANLVICIARCLLAPAQSQTAAARRRSSARELPPVRRIYSLKPVYVMNPGGSLRIGKQESKNKGGAGRGGGASVADLAERGMAQGPPEASGEHHGAAEGSREDAAEEV